MIRKTLTALALASALASPAFAAPEPISRQEMMDLGTCAFTTGIFLQSLEADSPTDADRALAERAKNAIIGVGNYWDRIGRPFDEKMSTDLEPQFRGPIKERLARYDNSPNRGQAVRDEFRADLQACATKFEAAVPADAKPAGGSQ